MRDRPDQDNRREQRAMLGWREWVALPELGIAAIKAKVDTGARTSALHCFDVAEFMEDRRRMVRFSLHPLQNRKDIAIHCRMPLLDQRVVKDSGGHSEERYVITTPIMVGELRYQTEITLTNREDMQFRMLLGRTALNAAGFHVNPGASYLTGRELIRAYLKSGRVRQALARK
jgi:hypothetical protein